MANRLDTSANLAIDAQSLDRLRFQAKKSPDQALKAAAQQFESVFLNMMLKSMREATPQDGMFDNDQTRMFTSMLDQQLAQSMANKGIGLADMMVKQLKGQVAREQVAGDKGQNGLQSSVSNATTSSVAALPFAYSEAGLAGMGEFSANSQKAQQHFLDRMLPFAAEASRTSGVPSQLILGQAALESGWGKREIRMADGSNSYNLFGIKANVDWNGKVAEVMTTEYKNGIPSKQVEKFRAYSSYAEAFGDYADMLSNNPRYAAILQQGGDVARMAQALQKAGYATDPRYAEKLVSVMGKINPAG